MLQDSQASVELPLTATTAQDHMSQSEPFLVICHALSTHCQILEKILMNLSVSLLQPLAEMVLTICNILSLIGRLT